MSEPGGRLQIRKCLYANYILRLQPLGTLLDLKLYLRSFIEGPIPRRLDRREMDEDVVSGRALDKAVAFRSVKPLHCAFLFHNYLLKKRAVFPQGPKKKKLRVA
jgi:hypothetical protein